MILNTNLEKCKWFHEQLSKTQTQVQVNTDFLLNSLNFKLFNKERQQDSNFSKIYKNIARRRSRSLSNIMYVAVHLNGTSCNSAKIQLLLARLVFIRSQETSLEMAHTFSCCFCFLITFLFKVFLSNFFLMLFSRIIE